MGKWRRFSQVRNASHLNPNKTVDFLPRLKIDRRKWVPKMFSVPSRYRQFACDSLSALMPRSLSMHSAYCDCWCFGSCREWSPIRLQIARKPTFWYRPRNHLARNVYEETRAHRNYLKLMVKSEKKIQNLQNMAAINFRHSRSCQDLLQPFAENFYFN